MSAFDNIKEEDMDNMLSESISFLVNLCNDASTPEEIDTKASKINSEERIKLQSDGFNYNNMDEDGEEEDEEEEDEEEEDEEEFDEDEDGDSSDTQASQNNQSNTQNNQNNSQNNQSNTQNNQNNTQNNQGNTQNNGTKSGVSVHERQTPRRGKKNGKYSGYKPISNEQWKQIKKSDGTNLSNEEIEIMKKREKELMYAVKKFRDMFQSDDDYSEATHEYIESMLGYKPSENPMFDTNIDLDKISEGLRKELEKAFADTPWTENPTEYSKHKYIDVYGESKDYTMAKMNVDWGKWLNDNCNTTEQAITSIRGILTNSVLNQFGGTSRISDITILDERLIINGVAYVPMVEPEYRDKANLFPLDIIDKLKSGCIASLFDWSTISYMKNLTTLNFDSQDFVIRYVATSNNCYYDFGIEDLFSLNTHVQVIRLGKNTVKRSDLKQEEIIKPKKAFGRIRKAFCFEDGFKLSLVGVTNTWHDYNKKNLSTYATSRGDKGLFMFGGGVLARTSLWLASGALNTISHFGKGVWSLLSGLVSDGADKAENALVEAVEDID